MKLTLLIKSVDPRISIKDDSPIPVGFDLVCMAREQLDDKRISPRALSERIKCDYNTYFNNEDKDKLPGERRIELDVTDMVSEEEAQHFAGRHTVTVYVPGGYTGRYAALLATGEKETEGNPYRSCKDKTCGSECDCYSATKCSGILYALRLIGSPVSFFLHKILRVNLRRHFSHIEIENKLNVELLYREWINAGAPTHWDCTEAERRDLLIDSMADRMLAGDEVTSGYYTDPVKVLGTCRSAAVEVANMVKNMDHVIATYQEAKAEEEKSKASEA